MSVIKVTLPPGELPVNGKQVTFKTPCDCTATDAIQIEGVNYTICDALGRCITGSRGVWAAGEIISVILDTESNKALIQNAATFTHDEVLSPATAALFGFGANAVPDDVFNAIATKGAKIATGSYTGTGDSGSVTLNFDFEPKLVMIYESIHWSKTNNYGDEGCAVYFWGAKTMLQITGGWSDSTSTTAYAYAKKVSTTGNTLSWSGHYMNQTNGTYNTCTYYFVAIG